MNCDILLTPLNGSTQAFRYTHASMDGKLMVPRVHNELEIDAYEQIIKTLEAIKAPNAINGVEACRDRVTTDLIIMLKAACPQYYLRSFIPTPVTSSTAGNNLREKLLLFATKLGHQMDSISANEFTCRQCGAKLFRDRPNDETAWIPQRTGLPCPGSEPAL